MPTSPPRIRYQTVEVGPLDIHLRTLRDTQQMGEDGGARAELLGVSPSMWPLFGVVWPSSHALAALMLEHPIDGCRVLEVGCGIALPSLVLSQRAADVTACDHNPEAGVFLGLNTALNEGADIPFFQAGWEDAAPPALGTFDLIIGSDVLYEPDHSELLATFILRHARPTCQVIIVDQRRGRASRFTQRLVAAGFSDDRQLVSVLGGSDASVRCHVMRFTRG